MRAVRPMVLALLILAAAGCGSDDADPPDPAADREVIDNAVITVDDLPDGFEATEPDAEDDDEDTDECFDEVGADPDALDDAKVVEGDDAEFQLLTDDSAVGITAAITSFDETEAPRANLEAVGSDDFLDCAIESIEQSSADEGQEPGDVDAEAIDSPIDRDDAAAVRFHFESQGAPVTVEQHLVLVGRFGIALQVLVVGGEPDEDLVADLLETMIDRVEAATS